jgi:hypothetical protein
LLLDDVCRGHPGEENDGTVGHRTCTVSGGGGGGRDGMRKAVDDGDEGACRTGRVWGVVAADGAWSACERVERTAHLPPLPSRKGLPPCKGE